MPVGSRIDTENVSLGLGDLEVGEYVDGAFVSYRDVGVIRAAVNLTWTREVISLETGRPLRVVKQEVVRESVTLAFTLAEITTANLRMALGTGVLSSNAIPSFMDSTAIAPAGDLTSSTIAVTNADILEVGGSCELNEVALRFTHQKGCDQEPPLRQIVEIFKATPGGSLTLPFNEAEWNQFEATFNALADTTRARGKQYMMFVDER